MTKADQVKDFFGSIIVFFMFAIPIVAWITHIIFCIKAAAYTGSAIALLILGMAVFPIGILHGICIWFGFTWV